MTDRPDLAELRALAEAATPSADPTRYSITTAANRAFRGACSPERILALIAEVEDRRGAVERIQAFLDETIPPKERWGMYPGFLRETVLKAAFDREEARHAR